MLTFNTHRQIMGIKSTIRHRGNPGIDTHLNAFETDIYSGVKFCSKFSVPNVESVIVHDFAVSSKY